MDTTEVEVCRDAAKRDVRGRRVLESGERERLLAAYAESGLTQKAFARREGVNYHTFVAWLGRERQGAPACGQKAVSFREVVVGGGAPHAPLEARLSDGTVVRAEEAGALAALIRLLRD
jgi:transposase-like protein